MGDYPSVTVAEWLRAMVAGDLIVYKMPDFPFWAAPGSIQFLIDRCEAELALLDDLEKEEHYWNSCPAGWHRTGNAVIPECICGRDENVNRRILLLARGYQSRGGWDPDWEK